MKFLEVLHALSWCTERRLLPFLRLSPSLRIRFLKQTVTYLTKELFSSDLARCFSTYKVMLAWVKRQTWMAAGARFLILQLKSEYVIIDYNTKHTSVRGRPAFS
jgi:hypothetical protein